MSDSEGRYDALLIVSFGGPEGPDDVMPFLDNVLKGLPVKPEAKQDIARRYQRFGGVSPINSETRQFIDALKTELAAHDIELPIYWGNRNWHPILADTLAEMQDTGISRVLAHVTSTFSSYSGCRKYREDLYDACADLENPPAIDKLRLGYNHPGFIAAMADRGRTACPCQWRKMRTTSSSSQRPAAWSPKKPAATTGRSATRATTHLTVCRGSNPTSMT
jgi:ferrochelatase